MNKSYWRDRCRPVIEKVLEDTKGKDEKEIQKELRKAYPFGERARWPYKVWLDEIKVQRNLKIKKDQEIIDPKQQKLF